MALLNPQIDPICAPTTRSNVDPEPEYPLLNRTTTLVASVGLASTGVGSATPSRLWKEFHNPLSGV